MKKSVMRIFLSVLVCAALALSLGAVALADVIYEPNDNFYAKNHEECEPVSRTYIANAADGSVGLYGAPGDATAKTSVKNGAVLFVSFSYTDKDSGELWGCAEQYEDGEITASGWALLRELALKYDAQSFEEDFGKDFGTYAGDYSELKGKNVVFWTYPESGAISTTMEDLSEDFTVSKTYTDTSGRLWGYVSYYYGLRNVWVCLSDPESDAIEKVERQVIPAPVDVNPPQSNGIQTWLIVVVAVVVIAAVIVIAAVSKKRKKENS